MKVKCLKCQTEYNISPDKIPAGGATATCKKCGNKIKVLPPIEGEQKKDTLIHSQRASTAKKVSSTIATPEIKNPHSQENVKPGRPKNLRIQGTIISVTLGKSILSSQLDVLHRNIYLMFGDLSETIACVPLSRESYPV